MTTPAGTPKDGQSLTENDNKCKACDTGHVLEDEVCVSGYHYTCENGTPKDGITQTQNENKCKACDSGPQPTGYVLDGETCKLVNGETCASSDCHSGFLASISSTANKCTDGNINSACSSNSGCASGFCARPFTIAKVSNPGNRNWSCSSNSVSLAILNGKATV